MTISLRRHIPEIAIEWALDEPDQLWKSIDGTLCFADISGFTALAEKLGQQGRGGGEELVETLSAIFGGMLDCARAYDGTLLKFGGDALLFLFQGPEHELRAVSTALEMRRELRKAADMPTSVGKLNLSMSVGLHSGELYFFLVGSRQRELVLAGPDASLAAETEGAANAGEIAVSESTAAALPAKGIRERDDGVRLINWRKAPLQPPGFSPKSEVSRELLRSLFPAILHTTLEESRPEPEHRVACIAFARFSGTDRILLEQGPEALAAALNETVSTAQDIFAEERISLLTIDLDSDGGKLFLGSGVPTASEDDEGRMLRALRRLTDAQTPLQLQSGINRGHVFVAEVGTEWRAAYSAMGDTTNTAARICAKAPPGEIYVHPSVLIRSRTEFEAEQVGPFTFKGKKAAQTLYQVGQEIGARKDGLQTATSLVGRQAELKKLNAAIQKVSGGTGNVLTLNGPSGMGKSRLLFEMNSPPESVGILPLSAEPNGVNNPYSLLRDAFRDLLGIDPQSSVPMSQQLEASITQISPQLMPLLALLGDVVQVEVKPSPEVAEIEAAYRAERVAETVTQLLEYIYPGPLYIEVEDAQWSDPASVFVLEHISRLCEIRPWLMLVSRRDDDEGLQPENSHIITLEPLSAENIEELVIAATIAAPLRPHEVKLVVRRAGGNPLFAEEIVRAARTMGSVEAVPDSVEAAMAAQVDALDPAARRLLRYATVLGRRFEQQVLAGLLESEGHKVDQTTLDRLQGFLEPRTAGELAFRNGLIRNTIYEGLAYRVRRRLHKAAGDTIEKLADNPLDMAGELARHYSIAGDAERTWNYARSAATRASEAWANVEAANLYQLAADATKNLSNIDNHAKAKVWIDMGTVRDRAGMFDEALEAYRRASKFVKDDPIARARICFQRAYVRDRAGAFSAALRELTTGKKLLVDVQSQEAKKVHARLSSFTAMMLFAQEHYRAALKKARDAIAEARDAGDQQALAEALVAADLTQQYLEPGNSDNMLEALKIYKELGDLSSEAMANGNLGVAAYVAGRWDEALKWYDGHRDISLRAGNAVGAATAASNIGEVLVKRGELDEAERVLNEAVQVMEASGFKDGAAWAEIQLGRILVKRGDLEAAEKLMQRVMDDFIELGQATSALEAALVKALAMTETGQANEALQLLETSATAAGDDAQIYAPLVADARAGAYAKLGKLNEADKEIDKGLKQARELNLPYEESVLLLTRAEIAQLDGRDPEPGDVKRTKKILGDLGIK